ncbi:MAG: hypothetical protein JSV35_06405 [Candidatus Bathyarchaeota archaeon]|nr:MAG: hypothetical protein JSV35_06405 [Candidatus Bathyarchaeota archaeon]
MRKLKAVLLKDHVDGVVRSLGEAGIVQFVDNGARSEEWEEMLVPHKVSPEISEKGSQLLTKIERFLEALEVEVRFERKVKTPITREPMEEVLRKVEQQLEELPVEALTKCSTLSARIDSLLETLGAESEEVEEKPITLEKPIEDSLTEIESQVAEIEKELDLITRETPNILISRIQTLRVQENVDPRRRLDQKLVKEIRKPFKRQRQLLELRKLVKEIEEFFLNQLLTQRKIVLEVRKKIEKDVQISDVKRRLLHLREIVVKEKQVEEEQRKFVESDKTVYLEAWVPEDDVKEATREIEIVTEGNSVVTVEPASKEEKAPIVLKPAPNYIAAFQKLVCTFGYPSCGDLNPARILAITFPILFGIMFADVGQGAIFILLGIILFFARRKIDMEKVGDIFRYLFISSEMFVFLGISAMFFGFIFGEFFGPSGVIHPISLGRIGPFYIGGFEPTEEPMKMLRFAILVGTIHLGIGMTLRFINEIRHQHYKLAPIPIFWMWLMFGGLFNWAYWGGISNISRWFSDGSLMLIGLIVLPLVLILAFTSITEGFMEGVGFSVEVFAETLSHSMSYSRLMALGLIHSAMNYLFLVLGGVTHGHFPLNSIPLIAVGTILVMIIEGLVVFVHTLRLHWVEWFSKFHAGEGIPFKPFKYTL